MKTAAECGRRVRLSAVMAMKGAVRLASVRGVAVEAHWSVPLIMLFLAYGLADRTLPAYTLGLAPVVYAVAGVAGAVLLLASLVVHEGAHALTARRAGLPVRDVTLWALGGLTRMDRPTTARAAFAVAVSGPLASLLLGGIGWGAAVAVQATLGWRIAASVLGWFGGMNLLLGDRASDIVVESAACPRRGPTGCGTPRGDTGHRGVWSAYGV
ncbi:site-2 protease family protein [Streptomyces sp. NPDC007896]|uniref:site-2 protease family protein n=1 Tax=Streptomyces sp. NPDC007896 TaxID=3364784 RepID=UPI0036DFF7A8